MENEKTGEHKFRVSKTKSVRREEDQDSVGVRGVGVWSLGSDAYHRCSSRSCGSSTRQRLPAAYIMLYSIGWSKKW